jgi:hypothetical protein
MILKQFNQIKNLVKVYQQIIQFTKEGEETFICI